MKLHENTNLFRQAVQITAQQMRIADIYVEKDYWVTLALHTIFHSEIGSEAVFKGGTALSKCFGIIERFSEDIDLVVLNNEETGNQLKKKLKTITNVVGDKLEEIQIEGITNKLGMIRKIAYNYPQTFKGVFGQVRNIIVVESTWLGRYEPFQKQNISSYIYDMMKTTNQLEIAKEYNMLPFEVQVLDVKRTICEKIMSLVRFSYSEDALENLRNKIRQTYDIHQLLSMPEIEHFFESAEFEKMLLIVGNDDVQSFKTNNSWLANHPKNALIFENTEEVWGKLKATYNNEFSALVYGVLPNEKEVLATLIKVGERLNSVKWSVEI
jgi:hypothetical protein